MRAAVLGLGVILSLAAAIAAPQLDLDKVAGVYKHRFENGLVDGSTFTSENILEIVKTAPGKAYVRTDLQFYNGHECSFSGIMTVEGGALVYRGPTETGEACDLRLYFSGGEVTFFDNDLRCRLDYCGMRGGFDGVSFTAKARRPIRYMARLLASREYQDAVKGKPHGRE